MRWFRVIRTVDGVVYIARGDSLLEQIMTATPGGCTIQEQQVLDSILERFDAAGLLIEPINPKKESPCG